MEQGVLKLRQIAVQTAALILGLPVARACQRLRLTSRLPDATCAPSFSPAPLVAASHLEELRPIGRHAAAARTYRTPVCNTAPTV